MVQGRPPIAHLRPIGLHPHPLPDGLQVLGSILGRSPSKGHLPLYLQISHNIDLQLEDQRIRGEDEIMKH